MSAWEDALVGMKQAGVIGSESPGGIWGASNGYMAGAHRNAQTVLNARAEGMLNKLSLDARVLSEVAHIKWLLQDITMSERRVHASNAEICYGMGDSTHLMRQRVNLLKRLDELIHLTGNERIAEFRRDCVAYLGVLDERREAASKYRHGQAAKAFVVSTERHVDVILKSLLEFVPADFGGKPEVRPRRGILRSLFTFDPPPDPTEWYKRHHYGDRPQCP